MLYAVLVVDRLYVERNEEIQRGLCVAIITDHMHVHSIYIILIVLHLVLFLDRKNMTMIEEKINKHTRSVNIFYATECTDRTDFETDNHLCIVCQFTDAMVVCQ